MTKLADLGFKTLVCTTSCMLLKVAKKWCAQCENDKTCRSRAENAVLHKRVHIPEKNKKVVCPSAKMTELADLVLKMLFCKKLVHFVGKS